MSFLSFGEVLEDGDGAVAVSGDVVQRHAAPLADLVGVGGVSQQLDDCALVGAVLVVLDGELQARAAVVVESVDVGVPRTEVPHHRAAAELGGEEEGSAAVVVGCLDLGEVV